MKNEDEQRFIELGWKLMECKLMYYSPELVYPSWHEDLTVPDTQYDAWENEYLSLAKKLSLEPTAYLMVGFNKDRPSSRFVLKQKSQPKGSKSIIMERK